MKNKDQNIAVALLQGRRIRNISHHQGDGDVQGAAGNACHSIPDVYEAIILCHALEEIKAEYPQLVGPLSRYSTRGGRGARPPNAPKD